MSLPWAAFLFKVILGERLVSCWWQTSLISAKVILGQTFQKIFWIKHSHKTGRQSESMGFNAQFLIRTCGTAGGPKWLLGLEFSCSRMALILAFTQDSSKYFLKRRWFLKAKILKLQKWFYWNHHVTQLYEKAKICLFPCQEKVVPWSKLEKHTVIINR